MHFNTHTFAFCDGVGDLLSIRGFGSHRRRHELCRIVALKIGRVERDDGVARGMRFVKTVAAKRQNQSKELFSNISLHAVFHTALDKIALVSFYLIHLLFTKGFTELIDLAPRETGQVDTNE